MRKKTRSITKRLKAKKIHRHPFVVPVLTIIILSFATLAASVLLGGQTIKANDTFVVQLTLDGDKQSLPTKAATVEEFLSKTKVALNEGDVVEPSKETQIVEDNFRINVYRARPVTVFDGDKRIQVLSAATTPRSVAAQIGLQVFPEDKLKQEVSDNVLKDQVIGEKIIIERATPVNLNLYGNSVTVRTHADTVAALLKEKNITVAAGDSVQPLPDAPITPDIQVFVTRFGTQIAAVEEEVPMETQIIEDKSLSFGTAAVRQQGSPGKKMVTYQLELQNGKEVGRRVIQEVRTTEPVKHIIARGQAVSIPSDKTAIMAAAGISSSDYPYAQFIINHENGLWCPTRWQGQNFCPAYYAEKFPGAETHPGTGYGLCQSTPAIKMATSGDDWRTNAVTQMNWCHNYALRRHGGWANAYNYWVANKHW